MPSSFHSEAVRFALTTDERNDAVWGRFVAGLFLDTIDSPSLLAELESLPNQRPVDRIRLQSAARMNYVHLTGEGRVGDEGQEILDLLEDVTDPWTRSSGRYTCAHALIIQAKYDDALTIIRTNREEMDEYGLSFGVRHIEWVCAAAELGLRHFARCESVLRRLDSRRGDRRDIYLELNNYALRARMQLAQQRAQDAFELTANEYRAAPERFNVRRISCDASCRSCGPPPDRMNALACALRGRRS